MEKVARRMFRFGLRGLFVRNFRRLREKEKKGSSLVEDVREDEEEQERGLRA